jgi:hypothetical protein
LTNEEFNEIVSADVRGQLDDERKQWLRSPDMLESWMDELKATMRKIDSQLTSHKAETYKKRRECEELGEDGRQQYIDFQIDEAAWRASAVRFKRSVEDRLMEAKQLTRVLFPTIPAKQEKIEIVKLRSAIAKHRDMFEDEPSEDDEQLWKVLETTC